MIRVDDIDNEDMLEQVIVRKGKHPGLQGIFYTFPDATEYNTKDLWRPHPTLAEEEEAEVSGESAPVVRTSGGAPTR